MTSKEEYTTGDEIYDLDVYEGRPPYTEPGRTDWYSPFIVLIVGVVLLIPSIQLGLGDLTRPGPGMWPAINAGILLLMAPAILIARHKFEPPTYQGLLRVIGIAVPLLIFVPLYDYMGLIGAGAFAVFIIGRFVGKLGWIATILCTILIPVSVYIIFSVLLGVTLRGF
ncbi:tripartite tricarboxylate transporter TctB family protein [Enteractinococcus coprophilus]|uniref:Putative tricarboxylic transport membrane protein n=1 Tax=Enteractinococcus coprophilus TaxID=1027633 RepID=A0A543AN46_9MICC|nr:tripartite tricarboxylate transporter TctB family protein [Enteractinococcus coprophilus]TQL74011.1 putative tricarboxylic transport membrane protein [Enteractinococcus coprophilus]